MPRQFPIFIAALLLSLAGPIHAQTTPVIDVYKSRYCGCCEKWVEHMRKNGFKLVVHETENVPAERRKLGMPDAFASCHTARIGSYLIEGHVPASDIRRMLKEKPKALGIAAPGMPPGSPGMDIPNSPPYDTVLVQADGSYRVFAKH